jgi:hypothetical protein
MSAASYVVYARTHHVLAAGHACAPPAPGKTAGHKRRGSDGPRELQQQHGYEVQYKGRQLQIKTPMLPDFNNSASRESQNLTATEHRTSTNLYLDFYAYMTIYIFITDTAMNPNNWVSSISVKFLSFFYLCTVARPRTTSLY